VLRAQLRRLLAALAKDAGFLLACVLAPIVRSDRVLLFGPPILTLKYIKAAIEAGGLQASTLVPSIYAINRREDFDLVTASPLRFAIEFARCRRYVVFYDSLDLFLGPLGRWALRFYKRLFGGYLVALPYGGDAYVYSDIPDLVLRHALMISYPSDVTKETLIRRRIRQTNAAANIVVGCIGHLDNLPRWDILPVHYYPVDVEQIRRIEATKHPRFTVVHSPNHRGIKGTDLVVAAVASLQEDGFEVDLKLLEGVPNDQVLHELKRCHVLVEQVLGGGYALSAMEGMAAGLPVISHIRKEVVEVLRLFSYFNDCPVVGAERSVESIKSAIRLCHDNWNTLSERSLAYVERYHSIRSLSLMWRQIFSAEASTARLIGYFEPGIGQFYRDLQEKG